MCFIASPAICPSSFTHAAGMHGSLILMRNANASGRPLIHIKVKATALSSYDCFYTHYCIISLRIIYEHEDGPNLHACACETPLVCPL